MFAWGSTVHGELGLGGIEDEQILAPRQLSWESATCVVQAACGECHSLLLTNDGKVYSCGSNDYGQLGHDQPRKRPQLVTGLDANVIKYTACGDVHSLAINEWGHLFSWGSNSQGQLGLGPEKDIQYTPKIIRTLATSHVIQVQAGMHHCIALTNNGDLYSWGSNRHGQLGLGHVENQYKPKLISSLAGIPISYIACGGNHSFAVSRSGAVFGWGKNEFGQLGINDEKDQAYPVQLKTIRNIKIRYITCGEDFSVFLTLDGGVFTCGAGMYGQLGHGSNSNEILPRKVIELMGSTITQVCCGRRHTLALVPSRGRVYGFGLGGAGQLGTRQPLNASTPQVVVGPWVSPSGSAIVKSYTENYIVHKIFAGGDHCFVTVTKQQDHIQPEDYRIFDPSTQILNITLDKLITIESISNATIVDQEILSYIETAFRSLACFNASFLLPNEQHYCCTSKHHGVDIETAERTFDCISRLENETIRTLIWQCLVDELLNKLQASPPDVETLRIYLTLPLYHEFNNPRHYIALHTKFARALLSLTRPAKRVVGIWWSGASKEYFERLVEIFKDVVSYILRQQQLARSQTVKQDANLIAILDTLACLNRLNHSLDGLKIAYNTFHLNDLDDHVDVRIDYLNWLTDSNNSQLYLCNYPFLFNANAKVMLLETDQSLQMRTAMNDAATRALTTMLFAPQLLGNICQFLALNVSRDRIVDDTLMELQKYTKDDLKKPLRIKFHGEEAEDAGGVRKEFFMLLIREILDPKYGMFKEYNETRTIWFSEESFEDSTMYKLIGTLCGLAIYNFTIIDLPFPLALYKKILQEPVGLSDVKDLSPTMAKSFNDLLEYNEPDFDEVFLQNFEISREVFDEVKIIELKPGGSTIRVTQENKKEFIELYIDYIFNKSCDAQFEPFKSGFIDVCGGRVLQLFHSHELMAVVVGNDNYDWHQLEEHAEYKNGYNSSDKTIRWFWEVLHELSLEDKKKFLFFLTGSDRIPIQGMKAIKIIIQPTADDRFLPVAHTCFNLLDLPRYRTKERLKYKLLQAIQQNQGFSLV